MPVLRITNENKINGVEKSEVYNLCERLPHTLNFRSASPTKKKTKMRNMKSHYQTTDRKRTDTHEYVDHKCMDPSKCTVFNYDCLLKTEGYHVVERRKQSETSRFEPQICGEVDQTKIAP